MEVAVNRIVRFGLMIGLIALLFLPAMAEVSAQAGWDIRITQVSPLETPDRMVMKVYFNVYEPKSGAPVLDAQPTGAQITLLNTNYVSQGQVKKPDVPIYITMVMDSSGSMGLAAPALRKAAWRVSTGRKPGAEAEMKSKPGGTAESR